MAIAIALALIAAAARDREGFPVAAPFDGRDDDPTPLDATDAKGGAR